jgi:hypothetical protein
MNLEQYVGRNVRLKKYAFRDITQLNNKRSVGMENCFLVAKVNPGPRELICYGENIRITVSVHDVVLV